MKRARAWAACLLVAIAAAIGLGAGPANAQTPKPAAGHAAPKPLSQSLTGSAKADFEAAKLLASDGDFAGARIKFQSAYDASKDTRLLWNVAFCEKNLRHYSKVVGLLKRYVDEGGAVLTARDKKEAQDLIATIEPFTTRVTFQVNEEGAQVFVDDELAGTTPLGRPVVLDIGERHLRVTKDGFRPYEKALPVGGSAEVSVDVKLEKEVHEGHLIVGAPLGATIVLDEQPGVLGKLDKTVSAGGHTVRVTAPGMRPFQSEVVVQDKETRSVDVVLEAEAAAEKPKVRVAVGCRDTEPKGPDDGMVAYLDGPDVVPAVYVKKRWDKDSGANVVQWVEYPVSAGKHTLRLAIVGCKALDVAIDVDAAKGADVSGALESDRFLFFRGAAGTPGPFRVALGASFPFGDAKQDVPIRYSGDAFSMTGVALSVGLVDRWFSAHIEAAYASGSMHQNADNCCGPSRATQYAIPNPATAHWSRVALRFGPRIPFHSVALGIGISIGAQEVNVEQIRTGVPNAVFGGWTGLDIQPLCDFGAYVQAALEKPTSDDGPNAAFQLGLFWAPNGRCRRERSTVMGLSPKAPQ